MTAVYFETPGAAGSRQGDPQEPDQASAPGPLVNAPWPVVTVIALIVAIYALQRQLPGLVELFSFSPQRMLAGRVEGLVTSQFLHGSWAHALMNSAFILAFGAPVARFFGHSVGGALDFFLFYLTTGVLACLGFAAFHWGQDVSLVGASGAASGLMGAAARLIGGQGRVGPLFSRAVTSMGLGWLIVNVIMAFAGGLLIPGSEGAAVGWEAHLAGFAAGALLIGPFARLTGRR